MDGYGRKSERIAGEVRAAIPVSYTHLDVYKRQVHGGDVIHFARKDRLAPGHSRQQRQNKRQQHAQPLAHRLSLL